MVPALLLAGVAALCAVLLTGVVKFGAPSLSGVSFSSRVDGALKPLDSKTRFTTDIPSLYCCARLRAFAGTRLEARWFKDDKQVGDFKGTFGAMAGSSGAKFLTSSGRVAFCLERPEAGWAAGSYTVRLLIDGKLETKAKFVLAKASSVATLTRYTDPGAAFSIMVPESWAAADKATLTGALIGFIAPSGPYPPRFVVTDTDFTSAEIGYLNEIVRQAAGARAEVLFTPYSIGDMVGARRTFEWEYEADGQQYKLRSIQVVAQAETNVYSIDCHSLAMDFRVNEPIFNAVINSFE